MPNRDNGFVARHYVPLADLDPRLADAMLDLLAVERIAAYVAPSTGHLGGYLEVHLPARPRDRLWVDREQHDRAIGLLNAHTDPNSIGQVEQDDAAPIAPGNLLDAPQSASQPSTSPPSPDAGTQATLGDDDVWASVLASFDLPSYEPPLSSTDSADTDAEDRSAEHPVPRRVVRPERTNPAPVTSLDKAPPDLTPLPAALPPPSGWDPLDLLDEHFVPPQPPPVPRLRPTTRWALVAIVGGLALLVLPHVINSMPDGAAALGIFLMIGGFIALIVNMRDDRGTDDDDNGAVV